MPENIHFLFLDWDIFISKDFNGKKHGKFWNVYVMVLDMLYYSNCREYGLEKSNFFKQLYLGGMAFDACYNRALLAGYCHDISHSGIYYRSFATFVFVSILTLCIGFSGMYFSGFICYNKFPYMPTMMLEPIPIILSIINIFILPITTTLAEDGLYLGIGVNQIKNKYAAIILPAFFYALQHSFIPFLPDTKFIIYRFISFLPLTILFCIYYYRKRNPLPIMVGHFIINIATVFQIFIMSLFPALYESIKNL